jgi:hypothetical protein
VRVVIQTHQTDADLHAWLIELGAEEVVGMGAGVGVIAERVRG